jgi:ribonuclease PH
MLDMALAGCAELTRKQNEALALPYPGELPEPRPDKKSKGAK